MKRLFLIVGACIARPRKRNPRLPVLRFYRDKRTYNSAHKKRLELNAVFLSGGRTRRSVPTVVKEKQRCRKRLPPPSFCRQNATFFWRKRQPFCHFVTFPLTGESPVMNGGGFKIYYYVLFYKIQNLSDNVVTALVVEDFVPAAAVQHKLNIRAVGFQSAFG